MPATTDLTSESAWRLLDEVKDPEIPAVSVVELGMIGGVEVTDGCAVVRMLPTFVGCPALDVLRRDVTTVLRRHGFREVEVRFVFDPPWSSDRITDDGRRKLREFGLAPPSRGAGPLVESNFANVTCPLCGSRDTVLESLFGPTLCRSIHYCHACLQSFEHFKPVG